MSVVERLSLFQGVHYQRFHCIAGGIAGGIAGVIAGGCGV